MAGVAEALVDFGDAAVAEAVDVSVGLLFGPVRIRCSLPAALVASIFQHAGQRPASTSENLRSKYNNYLIVSS